MPRLTFILACCNVWLFSAAAQAGPLAVEIDRLIAAQAGGPVAAACDDATFLRRVYLDFAGEIPTADVTRKFLADQSADKRAKLVESLLKWPHYARRMEELFHVMLLERRGDNPEWSKFLRESFAANQPWDQMVRAIMRPDESDEMKRGSAYFFTRRLEKVGEQDTDYPGLTRDVGRLFMGIDLQCAQCHNHLFIEEYKQVDFQGLYTVFSNTFIRRDTKFPAIGEKPLTAKLEFVSVFDEEKKAVGPRIPFGKEFEVPKPVPKGQTAPSMLALLAESMPTAENDLFVKNAVNRLWFVMMGRGLVHPLDVNHGGNPPSHPEVFDLLAREFVAHKFDIQWLLGELAQTQTYARSSQIPGEKVPPPESFTVALEKRISAEQLLRNIWLATGDATQSSDSAEFAKAYDALRPKFLKAFANPAKEPEDSYNATVQGALFLLNDPDVEKLFEPTANNLVARLSQLSDVNQLADELFLTVLVRYPTADERAEVSSLLSSLSAERRPVAIRHLTWALVASMEFSVNH